MNAVKGFGHNQVCTRFFLVLGVSLLCALMSVAQPSAVNRKKKPYNYIFTAGYMFVNDNEEKFNNLLPGTRSWNFAPYPAYISANKFLRKGLSNQYLASFTPYRSNVIVNDTANVKGFLASIDYAFRIDPNRYIKSMPKQIDPFVMFGGGITYRQIGAGSITPNLNLHLGIHFWFTKNWGLELQGVGKLALLPDIYFTRKDYFQLSAGISYRTIPGKKHTKSKKRYKWLNERQRYRTRDTR
ncbi:MAG: hypothetical protein RIT43_1772 [Bacteroidota bacterium]